MWTANFFIAGSLTMILPFLSLYIETFGNFSNDYVQKWSGLVFGATFVTAFLFSPIWGRIGDKYGRKKVLIILGFGLSISVFLMGYVSSVFMLFILRLFMGLFAGFISMSQALIATQTPKHIAGKVLGTLQTGNVAGGLFGPLIGGMLADTVGFQYTFLLTSLTTAIAATLVVVGVKEISMNRDKQNEKTYSGKEVLNYIFTTPMLLMVMVISTIIQVANFSIQPLLALYVGELNGASHIALLSGIAFSATGLGNLLFTRQWGKLGDRIGYEKVMMVLLLLSALIYLPQAFITNIWQLVILRFILGTVVGGLIPCRTAYIRQVAPLSIQGEVLGYNASFRFFGNVIGPVMGGFLAGYVGISSVFFVTSSLFIISAILLHFAMQREAIPLREV
ncbi:MFS transporter [Cytobacillus sp. S13-E01]|uniref:MFS transporter n=1 Tax=Cytobacillus sp. S13-E01 TaxID=3031326 RepID=UPI0023D82113|nr:MFS transporter [Cytobacillus sp. S13-E01]MDF0725628.1 MFS transporter [Cytobacillus sp. S13-E01]